MFRAMFKKLFGGVREIVRSRLTTSSFTDAPCIGWSEGQFRENSLFQNQHTRQLAWLLYYLAPELLQRWTEVVLRAAIRAREEEKNLAEGRIRLEEMEAQYAAAEAAIDTSVETYGLGIASDPIKESIEPPLSVSQKPRWADGLLSLGLSFMLFLGVSEYLGFDIQSITPDKYFLVALAIAAAICLTVAAKKAIYKWVKATRSYEPRRSFADDKRYANLVPFWNRLLQGDSAIWVSILFVMFEVLFAAPGLIGFLPPALAAQFLFQFAAFMAAGLAALVNIALAWGMALDEIRLEQEHREKLEARELRHQAYMEKLIAREQDSQYQQIKARNQEYRQKAAADNARLQVLRQQILEQQQLVSHCRYCAQFEHQRWENAVKQWIRRNPEKVEKFNQMYAEASQNGQKPAFLNQHYVGANRE